MYMSPIHVQSYASAAPPIVYYTIQKLREVYNIENPYLMSIVMEFASKVNELIDRFDDLGEN